MFSYGNALLTGGFLFWGKRDVFLAENGGNLPRANQHAPGMLVAAQPPPFRFPVRGTDKKRTRYTSCISFFLVGEYGYESIEQSRTERTVSVAKLGYVPYGPLSEEYECIDGYVRLPVSFVGNAKKCFLLTESGNSMIDAGINDGDLVLVRQQEEANYNDIVVALVDNEVTLKRYRPDNENGVIVLHPENKRMKDIVVDECKIQGVAIKVIKDLEN